MPALFRWQRVIRQGQSASFLNMNQISFASPTIAILPTRKLLDILGNRIAMLRSMLFATLDMTIRDFLPAGLGHGTLGRDTCAKSGYINLRLLMESKVFNPWTRHIAARISKRWWQWTHHTGSLMFHTSSRVFKSVSNFECRQVFRILRLNTQLEKSRT